MPNYVLGCSLILAHSHVFVLFNGMVFNRSNGLMFKSLIAPLMNLWKESSLQEITDFKSLLM